MRLSNLKLYNFRSYSKLNLDLSKNINIFYGDNGVGKTNIVESIYFLSLTKSFRVNYDKHLIKLNESSFFVESKTVDNDVYKITYDKTKEMFINKTKSKTISDYISKINVILFNPDDINIIKSSPSERRKFLNIELTKLKSEYLILLVNYNKLLKLRNSYLKKLSLDSTAHKEYLDILTDKLIDFGLKIYEYRKDFIDDIKKYIGEKYKQIFEYGDLSIEYESIYNNKTKEDIKKIYKDNYKRDLLLGNTKEGIHTDDLTFKLDDNNLKEWGSTGQLKNSIIAFKLSEIEVLMNKYKIKPILILDDLFSELDNNKVNNILNLLNKDLQTFITTTSIKNINIKKFEDYKIFKVTKEGVINE